MKKYDFTKTTPEKEAEAFATVYSKENKKRPELIISRLSKLIEHRTNPKITKGTTFHFSRFGLWNDGLRDSLRQAINDLKNGKMDQINIIGLQNASLQQFNLPANISDGEILIWQRDDLRKLPKVVREAM